MKFLKASGLVGQAEPLTKKQNEILHANIESFILSGGSLTLDDWTEMEVTERSAFSFVNAQMTRIQMGIQAMANHLPEFAVDLLSEGDGGHIRNVGLLNQAAVNAAEKISGVIT